MSTSLLLIKLHIMAPPVIVGESSFADVEEPRDKQSYRLVRLADDESSVADDSYQDEPAPRWKHILHQTLVPDTCFQVKGIRILDGVEAVRFLKFVILTFVGILLVHWLVRIMVRQSRRCCVFDIANRPLTHTS